MSEETSKENDDQADVEQSYNEDPTLKENGYVDGGVGGRTYAWTEKFVYHKQRLPVKGILLMQISPASENWGLAARAQYFRQTCDARGFIDQRKMVASIHAKRVARKKSRKKCNDAVYEVLSQISIENKEQKIGSKQGVNLGLEVFETLERKLV